MTKLYLASASPRRADLLKQSGFKFEIIAPDCDERSVSDASPKDLVIALALKKAQKVAGLLQEGLIIGADTIVLLEGQLLGKPEDAAEACLMLKALSGKCHRVLTGIALLDLQTGQQRTAFASTAVWMKKLTGKEIENYAATGEPLDKAGAYAIQGKASLFIERIEGCYFNVVGLPLNLLYELLQDMNYFIY